MRLFKIGLLVLALVSIAPSSKAGPGGCSDLPHLTPFAFETITVSSAAKAFTSATYAPSGQTPADMAVVVVETDSVRYRDDGSDPTDSVGMLVKASSTSPASLTVCGTPAITAVKFIRVTNDSTLSVSYYRGAF